MSRFLYFLVLSSFLLFNIVDSKRRLDLDLLDFNKTNWTLDKDNGVFYQIGLAYCRNITNISYQSLGIYVPKEYLSCNLSGSTYDCEINSSGKKGSYTSLNAPIVLPVETPGYAAMAAPTSYSYSTISEFITKGIIYVYAGCRGRYDNNMNFISGAPWPVTDLKSAIRYVRYNKKLIPGDKDKIYTFGMSGGGAQSCLMGITGNSQLFTPYLKENGAALRDSDGNTIKDNVKGSQCWCPITNLDTADAAYEWNIGQYCSTDTRTDGTFTKLLSDDLANEFFNYINEIKLKDPFGNVLSLIDINKGSYYDYLKNVIEESLNNFLTDTEFPYTQTESSEYPRNADDMGGSIGGIGGGERLGGDLEGTILVPGGEMGGITGTGGGQGSNSGSQSSKTYHNIYEYITAKNNGTNWIIYNNNTKKATITSIADFIINCKSPSKDVGAFDDLNRNQGENKLFGTRPEEKTKHFDQIMYNILIRNQNKYKGKTNWNSTYPDAYLNDLKETDKMGKNITSRVNMYNPLYYLTKYYDGYKKSDVADYFRINTGLFQSDTGNAVELNLYLALLNYGKNVKFTTVWEQKHVEAERTGNSTSNFISWIEEIELAESSNNFLNFKSISYFAYLLILLSIF